MGTAPRTLMLSALLAVVVGFTAFVGVRLLGRHTPDLVQEHRAATQPADERHPERGEATPADTADTADTADAAAIAAARRLAAQAAEELRRGELDRTLASATAAREALEAIHGLEHPEIAAAMLLEAESLRFAGELERAEPTLERTLAIAEATVPGDDPRLLPYLYAATRLHLQRRSPDHAEPFLRRAQAIAAASGDPGDTLEALTLAAELRVDRGDSAAALPLLDQAEALTPAATASDGPRLAARLAELRWLQARARGGLGHPRAELEALARQARADYRQAGAVYDPTVAAIDRWLASE